MAIGLGGTGVNIVISAIDNFSKVFSRASLSLASFQKSALIAGAGGIAIAAGFAMAVKGAIEFESAFAGVRKTVELTEAEFGELNKRFREMSTEIPIAYEEIASIGEIAGQLGVEGVDNLEKFTRTIADIAVTTNLTSSEAATSFARIANVMGEPIDNIDRMGSAIVDLGNNFATSEQEIVQMSMRIMGAGKTIGLSTQEVFGMSAALSSLGIRSEMGGSAISRAMITISKSVAEGGAELDKYAEVSGMTSEAFSTAWKEKPVEAMSSVILGLKGITESGGNTFGVLEDLDLKSIRISDTMLRLANSEEGVTGAVKMSKKAWEENTALVEESQKRYDTLKSQLQIVKNQFFLLGAEIGEKITPIIKDYLIPALTWLIDLWNSFGPILQNAIILGTVAAGVILLIAGAVTLLTIAASPWLLIILGVAVAVGILVAGLYILYKKWDEMATWIKILIALFFPFIAIPILIAKNWKWLVGIAKAVWNAIKDIIKERIDEMKKFIMGLIDIARTVWSKIKEIFSAPLKIFSSVFTSGGSSKKNNNMVNDFISRPGVPLQQFSPQDTIIGFKGKEMPGNKININIENVYGVNADDIADALQDKLNKLIST